MKILILPPSLSVLNASKSVFAALPRSRNPFEVLKLFPTIPLVPEKKTEAGNQVDSELIVKASEQSPSLNIAEPMINSCCKMAGGPTFNDSVFKTPVDRAIK